jgi:hypothetical protein
MSDIGLFSVDQKTGLVTFSFSNNSRLVSGPEEALQLVAYHVFTSRGSVAFDEREGGDMQQLTRGRAMSQEELLGEAALRVSRANASIRGSQSSGKDPSATVSGLKLISARAVDDKLEMSIRVDLVSGNSFSAKFRT